MKITGRTVTLTGPGGTVSIRRDANGVPRIEAENHGGLAYGLGWAHAHDRLVQMVLVRTVGRGEAAEHLAGTPEMVALDVFMRRMGFGRDAADQVEHLSQGARIWCRDYCRGVNDYLQSERRPLELWLAGYRPDPWDPEDVLLVIKLVAYMGLAQAQQSVEKFIAQALAAGIDLARMRELFQPHLEGFDPSWLEGLRVAEPLVPPSVRWLKGLGAFAASNNWALAGSRTASGAPIFSNDPHLEVDRLPAVWYEAVLANGGEYQMGATIPGIPGVLIGRNRHLAWGVTYGFMDQIDYFVEDCRDGRFRRGAEWVAFDTRQERIRLKGGGEERIEVHENLHGVLEGDPKVAARQLCRAWSGHRGTVARNMDCFVALGQSRSVPEAMSIVRDVTISLNWVLADRAGNIGYQQSGLMPRRAPGVSGLYPVPGWDEHYDWRAWVDPSELNHLLNPEDGYVATANEDLNAPGGPVAINMPMGEHRARRIRAVLAGTRQARVEDMMRLQLDLLSLEAEEFMPHLGPLLPDTAEGRRFAAWDCRYGEHSTEASRFETIYRELTRSVFGELELGPELHDYLWDETVVMTDFSARFARVLLDERSIWYEGRSRRELFRSAIERAFARPVRPWGELRQVLMRNLFFRAMPDRWMRLAGFHHGPVVLSGNRATVLQGAIYRSFGLPTTFAPSLRFVTDLATDEAHTVLAGGPSGRRTSPWYLTDVERWQEGRYKLLKP